jgi:cob(I)alamin adenosyltransferase
MKIYTGGGDRGKTSLFSGERVRKNHGRIEAYGDADELNSIIGSVIAALPEKHQDVRAELQCIQSDIFHLSSWLATTPGSPAENALDEFKAEKVTFLESAIDRIETKLPVLKNFILPGGHPSAARVHIARAVCRRTERNVLRVVENSEKSGIERKTRSLLIYLNRLSDYLFMLARYLNQAEGVPEIPWKKSTCR